ncbi:MAG: ribosome maturation factor RimP, partial [Acidobacteria bacterium]|nr:ribosome maturation factor RimP [Acidobacteriota bacterium]
MSSSERSQAPKISRTTAADHAQAQGEGQRLFTLLAPTVAAHQLFLEDVSVVVAGSHRTVSVVVDLEQDQTGGVSLDTIAEISRAVSDALDADPHDDGRAYDLEVSSPGTSRPLTEPRHWHRAL